MKYTRTKLSLFSILLAIAGFVTFAESVRSQPLLSWVRNGNSSYPHSGFGVALTPDGSVVTEGQSYYYINLGTTNIYSYGGNQSYDALTTRYNAAGDLLWARADGGYNTEEGRSVAVDASGNIYAFASFGGTAYFDVTNVLQSMGSDDVFLAKYAPAGQLLWVVRAGGGSSERAWGVAVDSQGNAVATGTFSGTMSLGATNLVSIGGQTVFVAKYSSSGMLLWAAKLGGTGNSYSTGIASGPASESYVTGYFDSNLQYGDRCLFSQGGQDGLVARFSQTGELDWVRTLASSATESVQAVAVAPNGEVWTCGYFSGTLPFGATNLTSMGSYDIFVAKYSSNGSPIAAQSFGGAGDDYAYAITLDSETNAYVAGSFGSSPMMFPGTNLFTAGSYDMFFLRLDASGSFRWAAKAGGGNGDYAYGIAVANARDIYLTGSFGYNAVFGATNIYTSTAPGFFLAKYTRDLPVVFTQPVSQALTEGALLALSVTVTGTGPFSYRWRFNGANLPGATNAAFILPSVTTNLSGAYSVLVGNYEGAVTSDTASVAITSFTGTLETPGLAWTTGGDAPWFSQTNITYDGIDAARSGLITNNQQSWLQTQVIGPALVSFYWKVSSENGYDYLRFAVNGAEVTNTSGKVEWKAVSYQLPAGTNTLRWSYTKDESESVGSDAGWLDAMSVVYAPAIVVPPASQVVTSGVSVAMSAVVSGSAPFGYQWQFFGTNLPGATGLMLALTNVQAAQSGSYVLVVSNAAGIIASAPAVLTVRVPPTITGYPGDVTVSAGANAEFAVTAGGSGPFTYQWQFNGAALMGATNATLLLTNVQPPGAGAYRVLVTGSMGSTLSQTARLTVIGLVMRPTLSIHGVVGTTYWIEYRTNVNSNNWITLTNLALPSSPYYYVDFSAEGQPRRFYRVKGE